MIPVYCDASVFQDSIGVAWIVQGRPDAEYFRMDRHPSLSTIGEAYAIVRAIDAVRALRPVCSVQILTDCSGLLPGSGTPWRKWIAAGLALATSEGLAVKLRWIPRAQNRVADLLARRVRECEGRPQGRISSADPERRRELWEELITTDETWHRSQVAGARSESSSLMLEFRRLQRGVRVLIRDAYDSGCDDDEIARRLAPWGVQVRHVVSWRAHYGLSAQGG